MTRAMQHDEHQQSSFGSFNLFDSRARGGTTEKKNFDQTVFSITASATTSSKTLLSVSNVIPQIYDRIGQHQCVTMSDGGGSGECMNITIRDSDIRSGGGISGDIRISGSSGKRII
eukprot:CAMPEP_0172485796 /NCGR_PEP_ID=MMETSP1066-20121228/13989_1 /TAXON_ID=671091 /ORGANISM="Coscinodiscus wailesii, Strain CCMP2513" /LENGTH=115 /DNA_ID=CAMNT_0013251267 /DNA_START=155 /DNA_END=502 /DNA_ORIENTATION=-